MTTTPTRADNAPENAYDVWLKFSDEYDEDMAEYEANIFPDNGSITSPDKFRVEWYHQDVGQVSSRVFDTYEKASAWLESQGFQDFSA